jgi:hypothetical protein
MRTLRAEYTKCPKDMALAKLAEQGAEPMSFNTLSGIFRAYRNGDIERSQLVEAIYSWQITEAKEALHGIRS